MVAVSNELVEAVVAESTLHMVVVWAVEEVLNMEEVNLVEEGKNDAWVVVVVMHKYRQVVEGVNVEEVANVEEVEVNYNKGLVGVENIMEEVVREVAAGESECSVLEAEVTAKAVVATVEEMNKLVGKEMVEVVSKWVVVEVGSELAVAEMVEVVNKLVVVVGKSRLVVGVAVVVEVEVEVVVEVVVEVEVEVEGSKQVEAEVSILVEGAVEVSKQVIVEASKQVEEVVEEIEEHKQVVEEMRPAVAGTKGAPVEGRKLVEEVKEQ